MYKQFVDCIDVEQQIQKTQEEVEQLLNDLL